MTFQFLFDIIHVNLGGCQVGRDHFLGFVVIDARLVGALRGSLVPDGIEVQVAQLTVEVCSIRKRVYDRRYHGWYDCDGVVFGVEASCAFRGDCCVAYKCSCSAGARQRWDLRIVDHCEKSAMLQRLSRCGKKCLARSSMCFDCANGKQSLQRHTCTLPKSSKHVHETVCMRTCYMMLARSRAVMSWQAFKSQEKLVADMNSTIGLVKEKL